jgi:hypothetical protein
MKAPKLYIVQYTDTKNNPQVTVFTSLADAKDAVASIQNETPIGQGVFIYKLGAVAPIHKFVGLWD